jgi:hypothetical protein
MGAKEQVFYLVLAVRPFHKFAVSAINQFHLLVQEVGKEQEQTLQKEVPALEQYEREDMSTCGVGSLLPLVQGSPGPAAALIPQNNFFVGSLPLPSRLCKCHHAGMRHERMHAHLFWGLNIRPFHSILGID